MSRYIDAEYNLHDLWCYFDFSDEELTAISTVLKLIPTADVVERRRGKWEFYSRDEDAFDVYGNESWAIRYYCSNCNFMHAFIENHTAQYNFCPNCGSDMRGDEDEHNN